MIDELREVLDSVQEFQTLSEINFLDQIMHKESDLNLIRFNSYENQKVLTFQYTKSSIIESCMKTLTSEKNPPKMTAYNSNSSQLSNLPPKSQKVPFVEPIRGFRKAAFSNISNCQNSKPQKKVSARK